jgi:GntR family transcriptional regulator/MocR family aminotransferase
MENPWLPTVAIDDNDVSPLFARIAKAIVDDVQRGRLRPGDALPGSRTLADSLGVHRNTVLNAFRTLVSEGWLETESAHSTCVARALPEQKAKRFSSHAPVRTSLPTHTPYELAPSLPVREREVPKGSIALFGGMPDLSLFPVESFVRAYRKALRKRARVLLDYSDPRGTPELRSAICTMLSSVRGVAATPDEVLITRGSIHALYLLSRSMFKPGDVVVTESWGYPPAWETFAQAGATVVPCAIDRDGLDIQALERVLEQHVPRPSSARSERPWPGRVRAVYVTPHHQYPTTVTLSAPRRMALLSLAKKHGFCIIEDDYDHEFHYEGRPVLPLASADPHGHVAYVGTLSKLLAPGLRTGFVVGPKQLVENLSARRMYVDRQGDHGVECAIAELLEDGEVRRHARKAKNAYKERRDTFVQALESELGDELSFEAPRGGMAVWSKLLRLKRADLLVDAAAECGVTLQRTSAFCADRRDRPYVRLGFAAHSVPVLEQAVARLKRAFAIAHRTK